MAASAQYQTEMSNINKQLQGYSKDLPGQIKGEIERAWTPGLERAVGQTQRQMSEYLPQFWSTAEQAGGTTQADLSPTQKLAMMGRELGTMGGRLGATQSISDYLGGQMTDMYGQAQQAAQLGQQNLSDEYNRAFGMYQIERSAEEAAAARAQAAQLQREMIASQYAPTPEQVVIPNQGMPGVDPEVERAKALAALGYDYEGVKKIGMNQQPTWLQNLNTSLFQNSGLARLLGSGRAADLNRATDTRQSLDDQYYASVGYNQP